MAGSWCRARSAELAGGGARHELLIAVDDPALAILTLDGSELVREVGHRGDSLHVVLAAGPETGAEVNAALVGAGVGVLGLEPVRHTLEERFLQITSSALESPSQEVAA